MATDGGTAKPSFVAGPTDDLGCLDGQSLVAVVAARVAQVPEGRFWSLRQIERPRSRTYTHLWMRSGQIAAAISGMNLPPSSRIALLIEEDLDALPAVWACLRAGHVAMPLGSMALEHRSGGRLELLAEILAGAAPSLIVADEGCIARIPPSLSGICVALHAIGEHDAPVATPPPADLFCLLPTSGSTGAVKLVGISQRAMLYRCLTVFRSPVSGKGAYINTFPIDSTTGIRCFALVHREHVQLPMSAIARAPTCLLDAVEMLGAVGFSITNTLAELIMAAAADSGQRWDLSTLRQVGTGSETVLPSTVRRFGQFLQRCGAPADIVRAGYGTTETGMLVTGADPLASDLVGGLGVPLGTAAPNVGIRIVDASGAVLPEGSLGNVEVRAPLKMFSCYWGDPEARARGLTADGWWRTGDTGLLWGGQLALKGRTKEVFVFNGRKHALSAIDEVMHRALGPSETAHACTLPGRDDGPETLGVALLASPERRITAEAQARAAVATAFGLSIGTIQLTPASALPLTATGKVKRSDLAALLAKTGAAVDDGPTVGDAAASDDFENWLRHRVARATGVAVAELNLRASIVALGLDSLAILGLKEEITKRLGRDAPPSLAWQHASIAEIVAVSLGHPMPTGAYDSPVPSVRDGWAETRRDGLVPLSYGQEYTWRNARRPDTRPHYRVLVRFSVRGPLRLDLFQETLDELIRRHEHLRTTFGEVDGVAGQRIHEPMPAEVVFTDLSAHRRPLKELKAVRRAAATRDLDLEAGPLFVAYLTRLSAEDHRLYLLFHHILFDARSVVIMLGEVDRIYRFLAENQPIALEPVALQMADFARDERRRLGPSSPQFVEEVRWWREYWRRCAPSRPRFHFERTKIAGSVRASDCNVSRKIPQELHDHLKGISLERRTSLFVVYCAAAAVTFVRHSSGPDIVLGTYLSNRSAPAMAATIGYFLNLVQFHLTIGGALTWSDVVKRTHDAVAAVTAHRGLPHHLLIDAMRESGIADPPLQAVFQYLPAEHAWTIPGLTFEGERDFGPRLVHGYLSVSIVEWRGDVFAMLRLNGHRHHPAALAPLMDMFVENLKSLTRDAPLLTTKVRPPGLLPRALHAVRSFPFPGRSSDDRSVAGSSELGDEVEGLHQEVALLRGVAQERAELVEALHAEVEMLRSVVEKRGDLIENIHREADMLRSVAEERAQLIESLHAEAERLRSKLDARGSL